MTDAHDDYADTAAHLREWAAANPGETAFDDIRMVAAVRARSERL